MKGTRATHWFWAALGLALFAPIAIWIVPNAVIHSEGPAAASAAPGLASRQSGSPFPNLVENGDFESYFPQSRPRVWELDPEVLFLWDEFSRGPGEHSLFIDAAQIADILKLRYSKDVIASEAKQRLVVPRSAASATWGPPSASLRYPLPMLRPGASYLLSFWLARDRNIDGLYPTAVLGGRVFRLSDFWASGRWQKISLVVTLPRLLPPNARRLEILIPPGDYRLWIDDIVVRRITPDAALDHTAATLVWSLPSTDRLFNIRIMLSRDVCGQKDVREIWTNNVDGEDISVVPIAKTVFDPLQTTQRSKDARKIDPSAEGVDRFEISIAALASLARNDKQEKSVSGRWYARVEVYQYRTLVGVSRPVGFKLSSRGPAVAALRSPLSDGASDVTARATSQNEIATPRPEGGTRNDNAFDPLARNDNNSFPIGIYGAEIEDFPALRAAGFDSVHFSSSDAAVLSRARAEAARLGLSLLVSPSAAEAIFSIPLFFCLADEPESRSVSPKLLYKSRAALRRLGFSQPGAIALCRSWRAADYAPAVDVFMSDPYPIPFEPLSWLSESLDEIGRTTAGDPSKRIWAIIQAFPWSTGSSQISPAVGRAPTPAELKALVRLALLHHADGLFFYALQSGSYRLRDDAPLWQAVKDAIAEAHRLKPILNGPDYYESAAGGPPHTLPAPASPILDCPDLDAYGLPAVHFVVKRSPADASPGNAGVPLILALNTLDRPVRASLSLPGQVPPIQLSLGSLEFRIIYVR